MKNLKCLVVATMVASVFLGGCGASIQELCEQKFACDGEGSVEECVTGAEEAEEISDARGCAGEYNDLVNCGADNSECVDGDFRTTDECRPELVAFQTCVGASDDQKSD